MAAPIKAKRVTRGVRRPKQDHVPSEQSEQNILAAWLDIRGVLWTHVPNGGFRHISVGVALKASGVKSGVPDVLIFTKPRHCMAHCGHRADLRACRCASFPVGVAIELKRVGVKTASAAQQYWLKELRRANWEVAVCSGANDAIELLQSMGY